MADVSVLAQVDSSATPRNQSSNQLSNRGRLLRTAGDLAVPDHSRTHKLLSQVADFAEDFATGQQTGTFISQSPPAIRQSYDRMSLRHKTARSLGGEAAAGRASERHELRPFLKWAGGKRQLLPDLLARIPSDLRNYHEPFVGGGALFFALSERGYLQNSKVRLSDINPELINAYQMVRDRVETLISLLGAFPNDEEFFYELRALDTKTLEPVQRAARLIYLNKTCFNGLFRENRRGQFNVPYGHYKTAHICAGNELRAASRALRGVTLEVCAFDALATSCAPGDFVYCDPPYAPVSRTASFTNYSSGGFDDAAQARLAQLVTQLGQRGVSVLLSNSWVPLTLSLYEGCHIEQVQARRAINSKGDKRGLVPELLASAGPLADVLRTRIVPVATPELSAQLA